MQQFLSFHIFSFDSSINFFFSFRQSRKPLKIKILIILFYYEYILLYKYNHTNLFNRNLNLNKNNSFLFSNTSHNLNHFQQAQPLLQIQISYKMAIKILAFGDSEQVSHFLSKSHPGQHAQEESIQVETVSIGEVQYLLFGIRERGLVGEQATGTNGLVFFLGSQTPLFEEKQYITDLLSAKPEFQGVPLVVLFEKGQQLALKDVVNYLELFRLKERASMIKEVTWSESEWMGEVYSWLKMQAEQNKPRGFQAVPKVVKLKAKYREQAEEQSEKKYETMLQERDIRKMGVKSQQQVYIEREKEKLKQENMQSQLANFSRNKKKMAPYDIKPTPNPKIQPNLHFFLKDPNAQPPPQASIKIQTDDFKQKPAPPPYKPKKTGINIATQIEQNQLFNFDKEVRPILAILTTKALQTAALQIEQQEQLLKMSKYKSAYQDRLKKQKEHEQKNIDEQLRVMKEKDKLLENHRNRAQVVRNIQARTQCYQIANDFLGGIYQESMNKLITANAYADTLKNYLHSEYIDEIIGKAAGFHKKIVEGETALKGVFEKDVIGGLTQGIKGPKAAQEQVKKRVQARNINKSHIKRKIHPLYRHQQPQFSNFSKYLSRHFDGTLQDHIRSREQSIQQVADRVHGGESTEQELHRAKGKDSLQFYSAGHQAYLIGNTQEVCFTWTTNRYEKSSEASLSSGLVFLDKEGEILDDVIFGGVAEKFTGCVTAQRGLRSLREAVNMDEGLAINLAKVPQNVRAIVVLSRFSQAHRFKAEAEAKKVKYSSYGVQFWQHNIPINHKNIGQNLKWQQLIKSAQGEQPVPQNVIVVGYLLRRRVIPEWWNLEQISYTCQPVKGEQDFTHLLEQISRCYYRSLQLPKEEEDEERVERPPSSQDKEKKSSHNVRGKSKKLIEEPKKKIVLKVNTKILNEIEIDLTENFQSVIKKLAKSVQEWKQFVESCENGWDFWLKGKKLTSVQQLSAYRKVGDLVLKKIPKVQQPKVQKLVQAEKEELDD